jgi:hypothetical protein
MTRRTVAVVLGSITFGLLVVLAIPPVAAKNITADTAPLRFRIPQMFPHRGSLPVPMSMWRVGGYCQISHELSCQAGRRDRENRGGPGRMGP